MARGLRGILCCSAAVIALLAAPAVAPGYTIGSQLRGQPEADVCEVESEVVVERPCTLSQSWLAYGRVSPAGLTSPIEGVVTRWSVLVGSPTPATTGLKLQLRTLSGPFGGAFGRAMDIPLPAPGTMSYFSFHDEHLPIGQNQRIGVTALLTSDGQGVAGVPMIATGPELGSVDEWEEALPAGETGISEGPGNAELLLQATVEPDIDRDGLGDESQDDCPSPMFPQRCPLIDNTAPTIAVRFEGRQGFLRSGRIVLMVRSSDAGSAHAEGMLQVPGKGGWNYQLRPARSRIGAGRTVRLVVRVPKKARKAAAKAVEQGRKVVAKLRAGAGDAGGNEASVPVAVRPKRP
jgi:hypothetical protein